VRLAVRLAGSVDFRERITAQKVEEVGVQAFGGV
jgi:hypothetical protein